MCDLTCKVKVTWHIAKYGDPYSEFVLCIYPSKCTHSSEHTHTHTHTPWTHTRSSGQPFMLRCPGSSWRFGHMCFVPTIYQNLIVDQQRQQQMGSGAIFPQCTDPRHIPSDGRFSEVKGAALQKVIEMFAAWHMCFGFPSTEGKMAPWGGYNEEG